jgi:hypothetical protein
MKLELDARSYYEASLEHALAARLLYNERKFPLSIYVSGLSVECLLRAFVGRSSLEFDEKHDLRKLFKRSKFAELVGDIEAPRLETAFNCVVLRWDNRHRFLSEKAMRRFMKKNELDRRIKGDPLKENCRIAVESAIEIAKAGRLSWKD